MTIPGIKSVGPAPPVPPVRDARPLHERIVEYLRRAGWRAGAGQLYHKRDNWVHVHPQSTPSVARKIAELDGVDVWEVTGRKPTSSETNLLRYMMAGRRDAVGSAAPVPEFLAPPFSRQAREVKPYCVDTESGCEEQYWPMSSKVEAAEFIVTHSGVLRSCKRLRPLPGAYEDDMRESAAEGLASPVGESFGDWNDPVTLAEGVTSEQAQQALTEAVSRWADKHLASNIFQAGEEVDQ